MMLSLTAQPVSDTAKEVKDAITPHLRENLGKYGRAVTADMWTEEYSQASYLAVTCHYVFDSWELVERLLATRHFDPELRHTGKNIHQAILNIV